MRVGDWCFSFTMWTKRPGTLEAGLVWKVCSAATHSGLGIGRKKMCLVCKWPAMY